MPRFTRQSSRPLSPRHIRAAVRRMRGLIDSIERLADATESRDKGARTRAVNVLSHQARDLARRNAGLSVPEEMDRAKA